MTLATDFSKPEMNTPPPMEIAPKDPVSPDLGEGVAKGARELARGATEAARAVAATRELNDKEMGITRRIDFVTRMMDNAVRVPGTDFHVGLDPVLGLLPGYGDLISASVSVYVLVEAIRLGAPPEILARMAGNIAFDIAVGYLPGIGDLFDTIFKANSRNARLIRTEVLGLPAPKGSNFSILDVEPVEEVAMATTAATVDTTGIDDAEIVDGELVESPKVAAAAVVPRPRPRVLVRHTSMLQKTFGYTLVGGLISFFLLPWAILLYFMFV